MIVTSLKSLIITLFLFVSTNHAMEVPSKTHYPELNTHLTPSHTPNMPIIPEILDNILNSLDETDHLIDRIQFLSTCKGFYDHGWKLVHKKYPHMDTLYWHNLKFPNEEKLYHFNYLMTIAADQFCAINDRYMQITTKMLLIGKKDSIDDVVSALAEHVSPDHCDNIVCYCNDNLLCEKHRILNSWALIDDLWGTKEAYLENCRSLLEQSYNMTKIPKNYNAILKRSRQLFHWLLNQAQAAQNDYFEQEPLPPESCGILSYYTGINWLESNFTNQEICIYENKMRKCKSILNDLIKESSSLEDDDFKKHIQTILSQALQNIEKPIEIADTIDLNSFEHRVTVCKKIISDFINDFPDCDDIENESAAKDLLREAIVKLEDTPGKIRYYSREGYSGLGLFNFIDDLDSKMKNIIGNDYDQSERTLNKIYRQHEFTPDYFEEFMDNLTTELSTVSYEKRFELTTNTLHNLIDEYSKHNSENATALKKNLESKLNRIIYTDTHTRRYELDFSADTIDREIVSLAESLNQQDPEFIALRYTLFDSYEGIKRLSEFFYPDDIYKTPQQIIPHLQFFKHVAGQYIPFWEDCGKQIFRISEISEEHLSKFYESAPPIDSYIKQNRMQSKKDYPEEKGIMSVLPHPTHGQLYKKGDNQMQKYINVTGPIVVAFDGYTHLMEELPPHHINNLHPHFKSILLSKAKVIQK